MARLISMCAIALALTMEGPSVAGTWQVGLQGDHVVPVALVLAQDGTKVTGTLLLPDNHGDRTEVELAGQFVDGALTLASTSEVTLRMHGGEQKATLKLAGKLEEDGSMSGTFMDQMPWTAERLKEKKKQR